MEERRGESDQGELPEDEGTGKSTDDVEIREKLEEADVKRDFGERDCGEEQAPKQSEKGKDDQSGEKKGSNRASKGGNESTERKRKDQHQSHPRNQNLKREKAKVKRSVEAGEASRQGGEKRYREAKGD